VRDEALEQCGFAAMCPEIPRVKQSAAIRLDEQGVGVVGGVIDEIRRDAEAADLYGPAIHQIRKAGRVNALRDRTRHERRRRRQHPARRRTGDDWQVKGVRWQPPVVGVPVRQHQGEQAWISHLHPGDLGQK